MKIFNFETSGMSLWILMVSLPLFAGCTDRNADDTFDKKPRPIEVALLTKSDRVGNQRLIKASVDSWRTEAVSMEVGGRLIFLAEENAVFAPNSYDSGSSLLPNLAPREILRPRSSQLIARIDNEKYQIKLKKAEINTLKTMASIKAAKEELNGLLPAQQKAAEAEQKLAQRDYERAKRLFEEDAGSEAEKFRYEAKLENAIAAVEQAIAAIAAKKASIDSLEQQKLDDDQNFQDAKRNLEDCDLEFSSFRGKLTSLNVEWGNLITANEVIGTIQMMDPIMIKFEVSSYDSRRLSRQHRLKVFLDGQQDPLDATIYEISSIADPSSRTFTVKLLLPNRRIAVPDELARKMPFTEGVLPLEIPFLGKSVIGKPHASEKWIFKDANGTYVLKVENRKRGKQSSSDSVLKVTRVYVEVGDDRVLFYGDIFFREIRPVTGAPAFNLEEDLLAGPVTVPVAKEAQAWDWEKNNEIILEDNNQWLLRPGDLVDVDMSIEQSEFEDFSVPVNAISPKGGKFYIFLLVDGSPATVERLQVDLVDRLTTQGSEETSSFRRIRPTADSGDAKINLDGRKYVRRGAHYLMDGEKVTVVTSGE